MKMKKIIAFITLFFTSTATVFAQTGDIQGVWLNSDKDAKVQIYKAGETYSGKIIWIRDMYEADGKTLKKDSKNPNDNLKTRTILNLNILGGFNYVGDEWKGGQLYDPKTGKTYKSTMKLRGAMLEIRGYVGSPIFGKTTVWTRTS